MTAPDDCCLLLPEDCVLGGFGHAELDYTFGGDLNGLTSLWVPSHTGLAVCQYELPDPRYYEDVLCFLVGQGSEVVHELDGRLLGQPGLLGQVIGNLRLGH